MTNGEAPHAADPTVRENVPNGSRSVLRPSAANAVPTETPRQHSIGNVGNSPHLSSHYNLGPAMSPRIYSVRLAARLCHAPANAAL